MLLQHDIPGRFRLLLPPLRNDRRSCERLGAELLRVRGVQAACANPLTGSLLVRYDPRVTEKASILHAVDAFAAGVSPVRPQGPGAAAGSPTLGERIALTLCERLVEFTIKAAMTALV